jgi:hypothetical protein
VNSATSELDASRACARVWNGSRSSHCAIGTRRDCAKLKIAVSHTDGYEVNLLSRP